MKNDNLARPAVRLLKASLMIFSLLSAPPAFAQTMLQESGPGGFGIPIAPGSAVNSYTRGGIGPGGIRIAPGPAAQGIPLYHPMPGGGLSLLPAAPPSRLR